VSRTRFVVKVENIMWRAGRESAIPASWRPVVGYIVMAVTSFST